MTYYYLRLSIGHALNTAVKNNVHQRIVVKTTPVATYANYSSAVALLLKIMIASAALQAIVLVVFGLTNIGYTLAAAILVISTITTIIMVGRSWPTIEGGWSWSRFWAGFLNIYRIGYERPGLRNMPWKVITIGGIFYGLVAGIYQYEQAFLAGAVVKTALILSVSQVITWAITIPVSFALMYGIGYLFGGKRQRELQA